MQILVLEVVDSEDVVVVEEVLGFVVVVDQVVEVLVDVVDIVEMDCGKQKVNQKSNQLKGVDFMDEHGLEVEESDVVELFGVSVVRLSWSCWKTLWCLCPMLMTGLSACLLYTSPSPRDS